LVARSARVCACAFEAVFVAFAALLITSIERTDRARGKTLARRDILEFELGIAL